MVFDKQYKLNDSTFRKYPNATVSHLEFNERGVILHYFKDGMNLSLGALTLENAIQQWNGGLI